MADVSHRRFSNPWIVRGIHNAIQKVTMQKQCPIFERLYRAMAIDGYKISKREFEIQLKCCVKDGLVTRAETSSNHGKSRGKVQTAFRIKSLDIFLEEHEHDKHDWYCWSCHREGEVVACVSCPRVYHKKCLGSVDVNKTLRCPVCKEIEAAASCTKKEVSAFSTMLQYVLDRMKEKADDLFKPISEEDEPTYKMFVSHPIVLKDFERKIAKREFPNAKAFISEVEWIYHNAMLFYGAQHRMVDLASCALNDGKHELSQIDICADCYMMSNKRPNNWFSIPCRPPHEIVYAKLGNDPPWPAKVLRSNDDNTAVDVRFFGPPHQRAWIPRRNVTDLSIKPQTKKRSKAWVAAEEELREYIRLLRNVKDVTAKKDVVKYLQASVQGETAKSKKHFKKPKLAKSPSNDSDSTATSSEIVEDANSKGQQDCSMDRIRMTDDYKIITKLRRQVKVLETSLRESQTELEVERKKGEEQQLEINRLKRDSENRICDVKSEFETEKEKATAKALHDQKLEMEKTIEERVHDAVEEEKKKIEEKLQASIEEERRQGDSKLQAARQRDREEFQRSIDAFRRETEASHKRAVEDAVRKAKSEAEELSQRIIQDNMRRAQVETERMLHEAVSATKKKSWCSNCSTEAFYHCCWNTNYCSTDCQRIHWVTHRYQCTRELMNTCRSCQQTRQSFGPGGFSGTITPK